MVSYIAALTAQHAPSVLCAQSPKAAISTASLRSRTHLCMQASEVASWSVIAAANRHGLHNCAKIMHLTSMIVAPHVQLNLVELPEMWHLANCKAHLIKQVLCLNNSLMPSWFSISIPTL